MSRPTKSLHLACVVVRPPEVLIHGSPWTFKERERYREVEREREGRGERVIQGKGESLREEETRENESNGENWPFIRKGRGDKAQ